MNNLSNSPFTLEISKLVGENGNDPAPNVKVFSGGK